MKPKMELVRGLASSFLMLAIIMVFVTKIAFENEGSINTALKLAGTVAAGNGEFILMLLAGRIPKNLVFFPPFCRCFQCC